MVGLLPSWPLFSAFLLASLALALTPGPGVLYVVTRSLIDGRRNGLVSVVGIALGNLTSALAASVGLAALFTISSVAFSVVKFVGAVYLIYLGVKMFQPAAPQLEMAIPSAVSRNRVFREGFFVALLNPKTAIFFAAFLPQFVVPAASPILQTMLLGVCFVAIAALTDSLYAMAAGLGSSWLQRPRTARLGRLFGGGVYLWLGLFAAMADWHTAK